MDKLEEYNDITQRLVSETVACCPQEWDCGALTIQCDGVKITYQLKNPVNPKKASISELLRDLIDELYVRMNKHGDGWNEAIINWHRDGDDLKFKIDYVYPESKKVPWWRKLAARA